MTLAWVTPRLDLDVHPIVVSMQDVLKVGNACSGEQVRAYTLNA